MDQRTPTPRLQTSPLRRKPDSLPDHSAILDLVARFDDAVNRRDRAEFRSLWADDAIWEIGDPRPMRTQGADQITENWYNMTDQFEWLFRGSFAGVVILDGDNGTGHWPCVETDAYAKRDGNNPQPGYDNRAVYEDTYIRRDVQWFFSRRRYLYLWLSSQALPGHAVSLGKEIPL